MGHEARASGVDHPGPADEGEGPGVAELPVLLTAPQAAALEEAAHRRGLTAAQLLRRILRRYLECEQVTDTE